MGKVYAVWKPKEDGMPRVVHKECHKDLQGIEKGERGFILDLNHDDAFVEFREEYRRGEDESNS